MTPFLSRAAISSLWVDKVYEIVPRLKGSVPPELLLKGSLSKELDLDSLDLFELAAHFHSMFQLMQTNADRYLLQHDEVQVWLDLIFEGANDRSQAISFFAIDKNGKRKAKQHSKELLIQEAETWKQILGISGRIWSWASSSDIYGFTFGCLLPDQLKLEVVNARGLPFGKFLKQARPGDVMLASPAHYQSWVQSQAPFPRGIMALSSASEISPDITAELHEKGLELVEIYGSNATASLGFRFYPEPHFKLLPFWMRQGEQLRRVHLSEQINETIKAPEPLSWNDNTSFHLSSGKGESLQIAGYRVFPGHVAQQIKSIPGVKNCWVLKMKNNEGNRLKAWILPEDEVVNWNSFKLDCYAWIEKNLPLAERPKHIVINNLAPFNSRGLLTDWPIMTEDLKVNPFSISV